MGLDNGVILKTRSKIDFEAMKENWDMPYYIKVEEPREIEGGFFAYDICYWRKWWGFRNEVARHLDIDEMNGVCELTVKDVEMMRDVLIGYLTNGQEDYEDISTIWSFEELIPKIGLDIVYLSWLIKFMRDNAGEVIVEFYDSY